MKHVSDSAIETDSKAIHPLQLLEAVYQRI